MIATAWLARLRDYRPGRLAKGSAYALIGLASRTLVQVTLFILLARAFGAEQFGIYAAAIAIGSLLAPVALLGSGPRLVRDTARDPDAYPDRLAEALMAWVWTAPLIALAVIAVTAGLDLTASWAFIILAEAAFGVLVNLLSQCWQAHDRIGIMAGLLLGLVVSRLTVALGLLLFGALELKTYAPGSLLVSALYAGAGFALTWKRLGPPRWRAATLAGAFRTGRVFMAIALAQSVRAELNKPLLLGMVGAPATGAFAAAQRATDAATLPVQAFITAATPRIHRAGGGRRQLWKLLPVPVVGTLAICAAVWVLAPWLSWALGPSYEPAAKAARLLAAMPLITLLRMSAATALIGAGRQQRLMNIHFVVATLSITCTLALVPAFGLEGAIGALYITEGVGVVAAWWAFLQNPIRSRIRSPRQATDSHPDA